MIVTNNRLKPRTAETVEMFPELSANKVKRETAEDKYQKIITAKLQTDLFKKD